MKQARNDISINKHLGKIPKEVSHVTSTLEKAGFKTYLVGGCVRDLLLGKKPRDWDVTTDATPEKIIGLFPHTFYENEYGTVGVVNEESLDETLKTIEVTPFRLESEYSDARRPDSVMFAKTIDEDLKRRDFTINAIALSIKDRENGLVEILDPYKGQKDINDHLLRTVGKPDDRFGEDALRTLRAIRIAAETGFEIDEETKAGIRNNVKLLEKISKERIRDEFVKLIMSKAPKMGLELAHQLGLLEYISPELVSTIGVGQNKSHIYDVWEHLLRALQHAADKDFSLEIRLAALFHDISKPETKRRSVDGKDYTFYGHDVVGERVVKRILTNLKFQKKIIDDVSKLVRWHMFFSDTEEITLGAVRRLIVNVGKDRIWDLMSVRACDRIGMGRPKESPYRLRKYHSMLEEAMRDPVSVGMLKIDGKGIMEATKLLPGPKIGFILHALFEEVLDDPTKNTKEYLERKALELAELSEAELREKGERGKLKKEERNEEELEEIRKKHWVK